MSYQQYAEKLRQAIHRIEGTRIGPHYALEITADIHGFSNLKQMLDSERTEYKNFYSLGTVKLHANRIARPKLEALTSGENTLMSFLRGVGRENTDGDLVASISFAEAGHIVCSTDGINTTEPSHYGIAALNNLKSHRLLKYDTRSFRPDTRVECYLPSKDQPPPLDEYAEIQLKLTSVHALLELGDALHFYLWLIGRSASKDGDSLVRFKMGDYGPMERDYLNRPLVLDLIFVHQQGLLYRVNIKNLQSDRLRQLMERSSPAS